MNSNSKIHSKMKTVLLVILVFCIQLGINAQESKEQKVYYDSGQLKQVGMLENGIAQGDWKIYHENGKLKSSGEILDGKQDGEWKYYNTSGELTTVIPFVQGKESGVVKIYGSNGELKFEKSFEAGVETGESKQYHKNGQLMIVGMMEKGVHQGIWKTYAENGNVESEGGMLNGNKSGQWKSYLPNGHLYRIAIYVDGVQEGVVKYFHNSGRLQSTGLMNDFVSYGEWKEYAMYSDEVVAVGNMEKGEKSGIWKTFENGQLASKLQYSNGNLTGIALNYYPESGIIKSSITWENGVKHGESKIYKKDGKKEYVKNYSNGEQNGEANFYYDNGTVYLKGAFKADKKSGTWTGYYENGKIRSIDEYSNGKRVKHREFNKSGEEYFFEVSKMAKFKGGESAKELYFKENMKYPEDAMKKRIEGVIDIQFSIDEYGSIYDVEIISLNGSKTLSLMEEAKRLVANMPRWTPAMAGGNSVNTKMTISVTFKISDHN